MWARRRGVRIVQNNSMSIWEKGDRLKVLVALHLSEEGRAGQGRLRQGRRTGASGRRRPLNGPGKLRIFRSCGRPRRLSIIPAPPAILLCGFPGGGNCRRPRLALQLAVPRPGGSNGVQFRENTACNLCHTPTREAKSLFAPFPPGAAPLAHAAAWSSITASVRTSRTSIRRSTTGARGRTRRAATTIMASWRAGWPRTTTSPTTSSCKRRAPASNPYASSM